MELLLQKKKVFIFHNYLQGQEIYIKFYVHGNYFFIIKILWAVK